jgi:hypothetical protein
VSDGDVGFEREKDGLTLIQVTPRRIVRRAGPPERSALRLRLGFSNL